MIAVDDPAAPYGLGLVEPCRPPTLRKINGNGFSEDDLRWFFSVLKHDASSPNGFEQALYYVSRDRAERAALRGRVA